MSTIAENLELLVLQYPARGLNNGDGMLPPSERGELAETERQLGFALPESLRTMYSLFGGQEYISPGVTGLFGNHRLFSPPEIVKEYQMYLETRQCVDDEFSSFDSLQRENSGWWHPALIPFASWDDYSLVMCRDTQRIWEFEPYQGLSVRCFENLGQLLEAALDAATSMEEPSLDFNSTDSQ